MQHFQRCREEIRLLFQIEPQQTMALKRQALGAQTVIHSLAVAIRQKLAEMSTTNGALHLIANIKRTDQKAKQIAQLDEPLSGKNLREKRNQFLHLR